MTKQHSKNYLSEMRWTMSRVRTIDDQTLADMLSMIHYEADRQAVMDQIGLRDTGSSIGVLLDFVLDAIGVPADGSRQFIEGSHAKFSHECRFSREKFWQMVFGDFAAEHEGSDNPPTEKLLADLKREAAGDLRSHYVIDVNRPCSQ